MLRSMQVRCFIGTAWVRDRCVDFRRNGWCLKDPCGVFSAILTHCLMLFGVYVVCTRLAGPFVGSHAAVVVPALAVFVGLYLLAAVAHLRCMLTNPGTVETNTAAEDAPATLLDALGYTQVLCRKCMSYKAHQTHHCRTCGRCIQRMDHHCPWMNNCVGARNTKYFLLFLLYIAGMAGAAFGGIAAKFAYCQSANFPEVCTDNVAKDLVMLGILVFVALLFGLFTLGMFCDMMCSIRNNTTQIGRLKNDYGEKRPFMDNLIELFGEKLSYRWLLPCFDAPNAGNHLYASISTVDDTERALSVPAPRIDIV